MERAIGADFDNAGLLAVGGGLDVPTLERAYSKGIFPWFSGSQPILWWSPDPRMVLHVAEFRLSRSLHKSLTRFQMSAGCEIRMDSAFDEVIRNCAQSPRHGQSGTWIVESMIDAYCALHRAGLAHSVETWVNGRLEGGLYCVALGKAVFGESMFSRKSDASKIALSALVGFCRHCGVNMIDCQQKTAHLASLGAREISRDSFIAHINSAQTLAPANWHFEPLYWNQLFMQR